MKGMKQGLIERFVIGVGCFVLGAFTDEQYRRWGRRRLLEALGLEGVV